jgi:hypothetical protein
VAQLKIPAMGDGKRQPANVTSYGHRRLQRAQDFALAINLALATVLVVVWGDGVFVPLVDLANKINRQLGLRAGNQEGNQGHP